MTTATHSHPLATVAAIVATAARENVDAERLAGAFLGEVGDDPVAAAYLAAVLIDRCEPTRAVRANHTAIRMDEPRGDEARHAPAPDAYTRVQSSTVQRRSNTGIAYREVMVHGRSYVAGSPRGTATGACSMSMEALEHALDTAPRTSTGAVDGIAVSRLTDVAYPDLPRLSGADTVSWADFQAWDAVRAATPRRGHRARITLPRVRASEVYGAQPHELVAYRDESTVWVGHRVAQRALTVRDQRALRARTVVESFTLSSVDDLSGALAVALADHNGAGRWTWSAGDRRGTFTVSARGRIGIVTDGVNVRGARTIRGAVHAFHSALATV